MNYYSRLLHKKKAFTSELIGQRGMRLVKIMPRKFIYHDRYDFKGNAILGVSKAIMNYHLYGSVFQFVVENNGQPVYGDTDSAHIMFPPGSDMPPIIKGLNKLEGCVGKKLGLLKI